MSRSPTAAKPFRYALTGAALLGGLAGSISGLMDGAELEGLLDRLAPDGSIGRLDAEGIDAFQRRLLIAGGVGFACAALTLVPALRIAERLVAAARSLIECLGQALGGLRRFVREEPGQALALLAITCWGAALIVPGLHQPVRCDEAITAMDYAPRSLLAIASEYSDPNNHILHSLAAHASWTLFGPELWALRIPAFLAGLLAIPVTYLAARLLMSRSVALLAAALVSSTPYLVDRATDARGYTMVNLIFLLLLCLSPKLLERPKIGHWSTFVLLAVAGFYVTPVMAYPFAVLVAWLGHSAILDLSGAARRRFLTRLVWSVPIAVLLAIFLYAPALILDGGGSAFTHDYLQPAVPDEAVADVNLAPPTYGDLLTEYGLRLYLILDEYWMYGQVEALCWIAAAAFLVLCTVRREFLAIQRLLVMSLVALMPVVLVFAKLPPARTLSFLVFVLTLAIAGGWVALLRFLAKGDGAAVRSGSWAVLLGVTFLNGWSIHSERGREDRFPWYVGYYDAREAVEYVTEVLRPGDSVNGERTELTPLLYEFERSAPELAWMLRGWTTIGEESRVEVGDYYVIVPDKWFAWRERGRGEVLELMRAAGYRETGERKKLGTSTLVRYRRAAEATVPSDTPR